MFADFRDVFNFAEFSILHAGKLLTGKRRAGAACGILEVIYDGALVIAARVKPTSMAAQMESKRATT